MNEWEKNEQIEQVEQTQEREQNESIPKITTLKCGWKKRISWTNQKIILIKDRILNSRSRLLNSNWTEHIQKTEKRVQIRLN